MKFTRRKQGIPLKVKVKDYRYRPGVAPEGG